MAKNKPTNTQPLSQTLRERAESLLRARPADRPTVPTKDVQALLHELQVHQTELELQNEELRQSQLELAQARDRYADLYEFAPVGYVTLNKEGQIIEANLTVATMLGVNRKDLLGSNFTKHVDPQSQDDWYLYRRAVFSSAEKYTGAIEMRKVDGTLLSIRLESIAFGPDDDRHSKTALIDITKQKLGEEALRKLNIDLDQSLTDYKTELQQTVEQVRLLSEAVANLGEGVLITDDDLDWPGPSIVFVNEAMCRISGYAADELMGRSLRILQGDHTDRKTLDRIKAELTAGRSCLAEVTNYRKDGTRYEAELFITPLFNAEGHRTNFVSIHRDISKRKRAEQRSRLVAEIRAEFLYQKNPQAAVQAICERLMKQLECEFFCVYLADEPTGRLRLNAYAGIPAGQAANLQWLDYGEVVCGTAAQQKCRIVATDIMHSDDPRTSLVRTFGIQAYACHPMQFENRVLGTLSFGTASRPTFTEDELELMSVAADNVAVSIRRVQDQAEIRDREERMRAILDTASDAIITIDEGGIIQGCNPATESSFGYRVDELLGRNVSMLMPEPFSLEHDDYLARYLETGEARIIGTGREVVGRRKDGSKFPIGLAVSRIDHLGLFTGIVRDISAVKNLQKQVLEIAAEEDRRIGHELHDNIQQQLTGLSLLAGNLADALKASCSSETDQAARLATGINETARQVHLLSRGLVPVEIDAEGLRASLSDLAARLDEQYDARCIFHCDGQVKVADNFVATHLYRITQEAINNAIKHSKCDRVKITLSEDDESIYLNVLDNGVGIDGRQYRGAGRGLQIMQYRAGLIGGVIQIEPGEKRGTLVRCKVSRGGG